MSLCTKRAVASALADSSLLFVAKTGNTHTHTHTEQKQPPTDRILDLEQRVSRVGTALRCSFLRGKPKTRLAEGWKRKEGDEEGWGLLR